MQDTEQNKLNKIMAVHPELQALFEKDVLVRTWLNMVYAGKCTVEKALVGIAVTAVKEKHHYYQEVVKYKTLNVEKGN